MTILGIETSTDVCSVGIVDTDGTTKESSLKESHIHSEKLLTLIREVCEGDVQTVRAVAVSIGPGSFTGLRIGLSSAKGLCYSLSIPIIAIPTLYAIAYCAAPHMVMYSSISICLDAKQGEFYYGWYKNNNGMIEEQSSNQILPLSNIISNTMDESTIIITDAIDKIAGLNPQAHCMHVHQFCSGATIAQLGKLELQNNHVSDLATLVPQYLKDFVVRARSQSSCKI